MAMARITRSSRLPDSLPVVLSLLEARVEGLTIPEMQAAIEARGLWPTEEDRAPRAVYYRLYAILKLLRQKGIVRQEETGGRETLWILDREEYARQRRLELTEILRPFVDGCLMVSDPAQFVGQIQDLIEDGTMDAMLAARRAQGRRRR